MCALILPLNYSTRLTTLQRRSQTIGRVLGVAQRQQRARELSAAAASVVDFRPTAVAAAREKHACQASLHSVLSSRRTATEKGAARSEGHLCRLPDQAGTENADLEAALLRAPALDAHLLREPRGLRQAARVL